MSLDKRHSKPRRSSFPPSLPEDIMNAVASIAQGALDDPHIWAQVRAALRSIPRPEMDPSPPQPSAAAVARDHAPFINALLKALLARSGGGGARAQGKGARGGGGGGGALPQEMFDVWEEAVAALRVLAPGLKMDSPLYIERHAFNLASRACDNGFHDHVFRVTAGILRHVYHVRAAGGPVKSAEQVTPHLKCALLFEPALATHLAQTPTTPNHPTSPTTNLHLLLSTPRSPAPSSPTKPHDRPPHPAVSRALKELPPFRPKRDTLDVAELAVGAVMLRAASLSDAIHGGGAPGDDVAVACVVRELVAGLVVPWLAAVVAACGDAGKVLRARQGHNARKLLLRNAQRLCAPQNAREGAIREALEGRLEAARVQLEVEEEGVFDGPGFAENAHKAIISAERRTVADAASEAEFNAFLSKAHARAFAMFRARAAKRDWESESVSAWFDHYVTLLVKQGRWREVESMSSLFIAHFNEAERADLSTSVRAEIVILGLMHDRPGCDTEALTELLETAWSTLKPDGSSHLRLIRVLEPLRKLICAQKPMHSQYKSMTHIQVLEFLVQLSREGLSRATPGSPVHDRILKAQPGYLESLKAILERYSALLNESVPSSERVVELSSHLSRAVERLEYTVRSAKNGNGSVQTAQWIRWISSIFFNIGGELASAKVALRLAGEVLAKSAEWNLRGGPLDETLLLQAWQSSSYCFLSAKHFHRSARCLLEIVRRTAGRTSSSEFLHLCGQCIAESPECLMGELWEYFENDDIGLIVSVLSKFMTAALHHELKTTGAHARGFLEKELVLFDSICEMKGLPFPISTRVQLDRLRVESKMARWDSAVTLASRLIDSLKEQGRIKESEVHFLAEAYTWRSIAALYRESSSDNCTRQESAAFDKAVAIWKRVGRQGLQHQELFRVFQCLSFASEALALAEDYHRCAKFTDLSLLFAGGRMDSAKSDFLWIALADNLRRLGFTARSEEALTMAHENLDEREAILSHILTDVDKPLKALEMNSTDRSDLGRLARARALLCAGRTTPSLQESTALLKALLQKTRKHAREEQENAAAEGAPVSIGGVDVHVVDEIHDGRRSVLLQLCHTLHQVARAHERLENVDDAEYYLLKGAALAEALGSTITASMLYSDAGLVSLRRGDNPSSENHLLDAERVLESASSNDEPPSTGALSIVYLRRGDCLMRDGDFVGAAEKYTEAEEAVLACRDPNHARSILSSQKIQTTPRERRVLRRTSGLDLFVERDGDWSVPPIELYSAKLQIRRARALLNSSVEGAREDAEEIFALISSPKAALRVSSLDKAAALLGYFESLIVRHADEYNAYVKSSWSLELGRPKRSSSSGRSLRSSKRRVDSGIVATCKELLDRASEVLKEDGTSAPRLSTRINLALAKLLGNTDSIQTASCLSAATGPSFTKNRSEEDNDSENELVKSIREIHLSDEVGFLSDEVRIALSQLPEDWTTLGLSLSPTGDAISLWRLEAGASDPIVASISLPTTGPESLDAVRGELREILQEMHETRIESIEVAESLSREDKKSWWQGRLSLDRRLENLLHKVERVWLGHLRGLFLGVKVGGSYGTKLDGVRATEKERRLVRAIAAGRLAQEDLERALAALTGGSQSLRRGLASFFAKQSSVAQERGPLVLIIDKELQFFPWESLPVMQEQVATRVPSLCLLWPDRLEVNPERAFYLLNPSGDLRSTQAKFERSFSERKGWNGVTGPVEASAGPKIQAGVSRADLFVYCGHNGAELYLPSREIARMDRLPLVTMLMGCSSGRLETRGDYDPAGTAIDYLRAGCPSVVANIWDVTDRDIDRLTESVLARWTNVDSEAQSVSITKAVLEARAACKMRYLVGAATVVYGSPSPFCRPQRQHRATEAPGTSIKGE